MTKFLFTISLLACLTIGAYAQQANLQDTSSYQTNGVTVQLNDSYQTPMTNGNVSYNTFTVVGNTDNVYIVNPWVTNGTLRVKNTSATNSGDVIIIGTNGTYPFMIYPGETVRARYILDSAHGLHLTTTNSAASQTAQILWLPN